MDRLKFEVKVIINLANSNFLVIINFSFIAINIKDLLLIMEVNNIVVNFLIKVFIFIYFNFKVIIDFSFQDRLFNQVNNFIDNFTIRDINIMHSNFEVNIDISFIINFRDQLFIEVNNMDNFIIKNINFKHFIFEVIIE